MILLGVLSLYTSNLFKFDFSDKIKQEFFKAVVVSVLLYGCTTKIKSLEKKLDRNYTMMLWGVWTNPGSSTLQNSSCTATYLPLH